MAYQKLGRNSSARKALFRDLVTDLFLYERIQTTEAKAKEVRSIAEKLITKAKRRSSCPSPSGSLCSPRNYRW